MSRGERDEDELKVTEVELAGYGCGRDSRGCRRAEPLLLVQYALWSAGIRGIARVDGYFPDVSTADHRS